MNTIQAESFKKLRQSICVLLANVLVFSFSESFAQKAVRFTASGDFIEVPHSASLAPIQFTIEVWLRVRELGGAQNGEQNIVDKRGDNSTGYNLRIWGESFPLIITAVYSNNHLHTQPIIKEINSWYHIAMTRDSDTTKIYLNGQFLIKEAKPYNHNTTTPLRIGQWLAGESLNLGLRGDLDELRIWNYARSQREIQSTMHSELTGNESGLMAYWNFNSQAGSTIPDKTPNRNDGVLNGNATLISSDAPVGIVADSLALVALYNSTNGANWTNNTNWLTGQPLSTCFGISVTEGRVTSIDLQQNNLNGTISDQIGNLSHLTFLRFDSNKLSGSIPSELGNLTNLTYLDLHLNDLSGSIPTSIGNLSNLEILGLSDNRLSGSIPVEIGDLKNLQTLSLSNNRLLSGAIPTEIGNLTKLTSLRLDVNQLTGSFPPEIGNLTQLQELWLHTNQLTGTIPKEIGNLTYLLVLELGTNNLTGTIPTDIGNLTNLRTLTFDRNQFSGAIPSQIISLIDLTELRIETNNFYDLPNLSPLVSLGILTIENNEFTFEDIEPNLGVPSVTFTYSPQDSVGARQDTTAVFGSNLIITVHVGGANNQYQWYKDGAPISGATNTSYSINQAGFSDAGAYICKITNTAATKLTLYSRPINVSILDQTSPEIMHAPAATATSGQDLIISATLTDNAGIQSATLFYRRGGATVYASASMANTSGNTYQDSIPASFMTERGAEYYLSVTDIGGNTTNWPAINPQNNPQVIQVTSSNLPFTNSTPASAYRMISVPIDLDNKSAANVLEDNLGGYDDTQWRLLRYINGVNLEFGSPGFANFEPGTAFWLISKDANALDTGAGKSVTTAQNFIINLPVGWSQIGNPFAFAVNWSDVLKGANVENKLVGYQGALNEATGYDYTRTQLIPFEGYFVHNLGSSSTTIEIPPKAATGEAAAKPMADWKSALQGNEWALQITSSSGRYLDKDNYIGCLNNAADEWDANDFSEAPFFDQHVSLYFPHLEWQTFSGLYTGDFRTITSEGHYWDFKVQTNISRSPVTLALADWQNLPVDWSIVLLDKASQVAVGFREQEKYTFFSDIGKTEREFRIVVGNKNFAEASDLDFAGAPQNFKLAQNYPNPFWSTATSRSAGNPTTRINYELPAISHVKIVIYNLSGQLIHTLYDGEQSPGRYVASWDGTNTLGTRMASGIYLVRMEAGKFVAVRKMILAK